MPLVTVSRALAFRTHPITPVWNGSELEGLWDLKRPWGQRTLKSLNGLGVRNYLGIMILRGFGTRKGFSQIQ
jgi:hypothetical protein